MVRKRQQFVFSVSGAHGVGKTTLFNYLKRKYGQHERWYFLPERLQKNPPIPFGSKDVQVAFRSEIHFMQQMIKRNRLVEDEKQRSPRLITVLDRTPVCVMVYSEALGLDSIDFGLIRDNFESVRWQEDYILYLEAKPETIFKRIVGRGNIDPERLKWNESDFQYLKKILRLYEKYFRKPGIAERVVRFQTDDVTPREVSRQVEDFILDKTGYSRMWFQRENQAYLTNWIKSNSG
ncbi:MAG: deoxynucleoside kinase [Promethearchaeota archaeon]